MAETFFHDPDALSVGIDRLRGVSTDLDAVKTDLKAVLEEHYGCWGDDEIGKKFAENFTGPLDDLEEGAENAPKGIGNLGDELATARDLFLAQDQDNANAVGNTEW